MNKARKKLVIIIAIAIAVAYVATGITVSLIETPNISSNTSGKIQIVTAENFWAAWSRRSAENMSM